MERRGEGDLLYLESSGHSAAMGCLTPKAKAVAKAAVTKLELYPEA